MWDRVEGILEPAWLADSCPQFVIADHDSSGDEFDLVIEPDVDTSDLDPEISESGWLDVLVTGRFDHSAARTCHAVTADAGTSLSLDPIDLVLSCRTEFVISDIELSGFLP